MQYICLIIFSFICTACGSMHPSILKHNDSEVIISYKQSDMLKSHYMAKQFCRSAGKKSKFLWQDLHSKIVAFECKPV